VGQQFGFTRARDCAGRTGRAGYSREGWRDAFRFHMAGSWFIAVIGTAGMNNPRKDAVTLV